MSEPKLTPWFPGHIKPVRPGVYEVRWGVVDAPWCYWDGSEWSNASSNLENAAAFAGWTVGAVQNKAWRGLAEQPK